ncbi:MAG: poly(3-hydroxybutyrate) depolymerase [Pseudomonadota bacterium]
MLNNRQRNTLVIAILCSGLYSTPHAANNRLPSVGANLQNTSVSGLSSGAFMTSQFYIAYSNIMVGAGIVAGGPYLCAQSWAYNTLMVNATTACMNPLVPSVGPNTPVLLDKTKALAQAGVIDPLENLKKDRIYIFSGKSDHVVATTVVDQTSAFFKAFDVPAKSIQYIKNVDSGHAFITTQTDDSECNLTQSPFINDCHFEQSNDILNFIYRHLKSPAETLSNTVIAFDQKEFIDSPTTSMSDTAYAYIPKSCTQDKSCPVHVVFHGCLQGAKVIGDKYYNHTGYNEMAEANDLIILYPQVEPSFTVPLNPQGCWDFWGYSSPNTPNPDYYTRQAPQLKAVYKMVLRLAEPKKGL